MKLGENLIRASGLSSRLVCVATCPCSMLIFNKQPSNLPQISAFLRLVREPWLYPFKKSRTFLLEVLPVNARMPSTVTRSIPVRSGGKSVQLLGGRQRGVSMKTGGVGLTAQVDRVPFDVWLFEGHLISPTDLCTEPPWPLFIFQCAERISFWGASRRRN